MRVRPDRDSDRRAQGDSPCRFTCRSRSTPTSFSGSPSRASLHEIREAYRRKAKQYHPDVGGDDWAFRIVSQAYETLSTARVVQASQSEFNARQPPRAEQAGTTSSRAHAQPEAHGSDHGHPHAAAAASPASGFRESSQAVRPGVDDAGRDPTRVVDVEKLWVRYEVDHLWLLGQGQTEDRFLSCTLNITWPEPKLASHADAGSIADAPEILRLLTAAFEEVHLHTPVTSSMSKVEDGRFQAWLSYSSSQQAAQAFNALHHELNERGLSVKQWTRDLLIPREWR